MRCTAWWQANRMQGERLFASQTHYTLPMKTATLPSIRVEPALRATVESVLGEGESLSQFVENAVRKTVQHRQQQSAFVKRGLASLALAQQSQDYVEADQVLADLRGRLAKARAKREVPGA